MSALSKTRAMVIVAFALTLAAGAVMGVVGMVAARPAASPAQPAPRHTTKGSWLASELDLTDQQQQQMEKIWSDTMQAANQTISDQRKVVQAQRDQDLQKILSPQQWQNYQEVMDRYGQKMTEINKLREQAWQDAVDRSKRILTPEQVKAYDQWLKRRHDQQHHSTTAKSTTKPATTPTTAPAAGVPAE